VSAPALVAPRRPDGSAWRALGWAVVVGLALWFVAKYALPYFVGDRAARTPYAGVGLWLRLHIVAGLVPLFGGVAQLVTGPRRTHPRLHRALGRVYVAAVAVSVVAASAVLATGDKPLVFRTGLAGLIVAWVTTTGLAFVAIRRGLVTQHREWMIRSYVVTFAFVSFRVLYDLLRAYHVGTRAEQAGLSAWFCWAVPLLVAELVLQGRKVLAPRRGAPA
jgi:uncharacterized membrane protein